MEQYEKVIKLLKKYNQHKIAKEIEKNKNRELIEQSLAINFEQIEEIKKEIGKQKEYTNDTIESVTSIDLNNIKKEEKENYEKIGEKVIRDGKYAVVTMAGGQRNKIRT